jgi:hypothetical protein
LLQDQAEYVRKNPVPRFKPILDRGLMKLLIIQGYLDQAEIMDELAARPAQVLALIQSTAAPHAVPDLFHVEGAGDSPTKKPAKGFSSVGSNLNPSPVRRMRMQAKALANQSSTSSRVRSGSASGCASPNMFPSSPSLPHSRLLESLRHGVVTIPSPGVLPSVIEAQRNHQTTIGSKTVSPVKSTIGTPVAVTPSTTNSHHLTLATPSRSTAATGRTSPQAPAGVTVITPRKSSDSPARPSSQEIGGQFRRDAAVSSPSHFSPAASSISTMNASRRPAGHARAMSMRVGHGVSSSLRPPSTVESSTLFRNFHRTGSMNDLMRTSGNTTSTVEGQQSIDSGSVSHKIDPAQAARYKIQVST